MNTKKLFSFILSAVTAFSISNRAFAVNAAEKHTYTLNELYNMNNEEFFRLKADYPYSIYKNGKDIYLQMKNDILNSGSSVIWFYNDITESRMYQANVTEKKIKELSDGAFDGCFLSPLHMLDRVCYGGADGSVTSGISIKLNAFENDSGIIKLAKCFYCINQVMDMHYMISEYENFPQKELRADFGDVNLDNKTDLIDAAYINKGLSGEYELTSGQKWLGDANGDNKFDILDSVFIRKQFMTEKEQTEVTKAVEQLESEGLPIPGDISKNGKIDLYDAIIIAENIVGKKTLSFADTLIADYTADCKIDLYDAIAIAKILI